MQLHHATYQNEQDLYEIAHALHWEQFFDASFTLRVDVTAHRSPLTSLNFATLRIKDAICDRLRARDGQRPSVNTHQPDVRIYAHLGEQEVTIYLDTSGEPLFKRGWRIDKGEAPIKENLAAGILRLSAWQVDQPLFDPMCGSGTFLIEAAQMALNLPAGGQRTFAFEKMKHTDLRLWKALRAQAQVIHTQEERAYRLRNIVGSDISGDMLAHVRTNWQRAQLPGMVELKQLDARFAKPPCASAGVMVLNPPYGQRITMRGVHKGRDSKPAPRGRQSQRDDALGHTPHAMREDSQMNSEDEATANAFAADFSKNLKQSFAGWEVFILSGDLTLPRRMRLKESRRTPLWNGPIECRLFSFTMVAGSAR